MDYRETKGILGLCVRAGQAAFGEDGCLKSARGGQCGALILDGGISPKSEEKYRGVCLKAGVPVRKLPAGLLEEATGRPGMAMAVRAGPLAERLLSAAGEG